MLKHIFKAKFIQGLRRHGYSKKQAGRIYERFVENRLNEPGYTIKSIIHHALRCGDGINPINYHLFAGAFSWNMTPQGHNYWSDIHNKLRGNEKWHM